MFHLNITQVVSHMNSKLMCLNKFKWLLLFILFVRSRYILIREEREVSPFMNAFLVASPFILGLVKLSGESEGQNITRH